MTAIFVCLDARSQRWQLGIPSVGQYPLILLGWSSSPATVDAGVPGRIAAVLAQALTQSALVTFPCSRKALPSPCEGETIRSLGSGGVIGQLKSSLAGTPAEILLLSTRRPESAQRMFEDGAFPWWMQGQIVLLSAPDGAPPDLDRAALLALLGEDWRRRIAPGTGMLGMIRPGVDGDVAGFQPLAEGFGEVLLSHLEREIVVAGWEWAILSEEGFARRLAGEG